MPSRILTKDLVGGIVVPRTTLSNFAPTSGYQLFEDEKDMVFLILRTKMSYTHASTVATLLSNSGQVYEFYLAHDFSRDHSFEILCFPRGFMNAY